MVQNIQMFQASSYLLTSFLIFSQFHILSYFPCLFPVTIYSLTYSLSWHNNRQSTMSALLAKFAAVKKQAEEELRQEEEQRVSEEAAKRASEEVQSQYSEWMSKGVSEGQSPSKRSAIETHDTVVKTGAVLAHSLTYSLFHSTIPTLYYQSDLLCHSLIHADCIQWTRRISCGHPYTSSR